MFNIVEYISPTLPIIHKRSHISVNNCLKPVVLNPLNFHLYVHCTPKCTTIISLQQPYTNANCRSFHSVSTHLVLYVHIYGLFLVMNSPLSSLKLSSDQAVNTRGVTPPNCSQFVRHPHGITLLHAAQYHLAITAHNQLPQLPQIILVITVSTSFLLSLVLQQVQARCVAQSSVIYSYQYFYFRLCMNSDRMYINQ